MASVPSASARAAVTRCPRRVLQAKGARASGSRAALEKRPAWHDLKPPESPGHSPHWTIEGRVMGARHRQAGRLRLGTPGRWGKAEQVWGVRTESSFGHHQLRNAKREAHDGTVQLGRLSLLFHWSRQTKKERETKDNHSPVHVPRPLGGIQTDTCLHVVLGPGDPNIWKWHLVWKKRGRSATVVTHSTSSTAKQGLDVHQGRKNRGLTKEAEEAHRNIPLRGPEGTNQQGLKGQKDTCKEAPKVIMLENFLLKEAYQMGKENTSQECLSTTKLKATITTEALLIGQDHASQEFPSTTQLLAICGPVPESTMLNKSLKMRHEGTCQLGPTRATLAVFLLENKYVMWKTYLDQESLSTYQLVATLVEQAIHRQEDTRQEAAEAPQVKEVELTEHDSIVLKTVAATNQVDNLEIQALRQLQQQCLRQWPWDR